MSHQGNEDERAPGSLGELFGARLAVLREGFIDEQTAAALRQRIVGGPRGGHRSDDRGDDRGDHLGAQRGGLLRYANLDRGSYGWTESIAEPALLARLQSTAAEVTGRALKLLRPPLGTLRALRLCAGDYVLAHHDQESAEGTVELMLDLSAPHPAEQLERAGVVYTRLARGAPRFGSHAGQPFFHLPAQAGALSIVERDPSVRCHHGYLSKRFPAVEVVRLVVRFQPA